MPSNIKFIDTPSISSDGKKVVFGAKLENNKYRLFLLDLETKVFTLLDENLVAKNVRWIDDDSISFIAPDGITDALYSLSLSNMQVNKLVSSYGCVLDGIVVDDKVYYVDYTPSGEELFVTDRVNKISSIDSSSYEVENQHQDIKPVKEDWVIKNYSGIRNFLPGVWAFLPYQLSSNAYIRLGNGYFGIPFIGPQFMLLNPMPLGRFSYTITVGLDYLKLYPDNSLSLNFKLPYVNLTYTWNNWLGGTKDFVDNNFYEQSFNGCFPINFSNSLNLYYSISLANFGNLYWQVSVIHSFNQYNFTKEKITNEIRFVEVLSYSFIKKTIKSSRWDRGVYLSLAAVQYPEYILDNSPGYLLRGLIKGRVPFCNAFFFVNVEGGIDFLLQNVFITDSEMFRLSEGLTGGSVGSGSGGISTIDTKAFSSILTEVSSGSAFVSTDIGFDITIYKKSIYWHFATLGFKEFYLKTYGEFVYLYNAENIDNQSKGILFDGVLELGLDLFAAYGNIEVGIVLGGAIGYRVGDITPAWGVFAYLSAGL